MNLKIDNLSETTAQENRKQHYKAIFFLYFIVAFSLQSAANTLILRSGPERLDQTEFVSLYILWGAIILIGSVLIYFSPYTFSNFGWLGWHGKKSFIEVLLIMFCCIAGLFAVKLAQFGHNPQSLFYHWNELRLPLPFVYVFVVFSQEYMVRGFLLTIIEDLFVSRLGTPVAIISSALIYATAHLYASLLLTVLTFFLGIILGIVFVRTRTITSVAILHYTIGIVGLLLFGPALYT